jgi:hypothetical protein
MVTVLYMCPVCGYHGLPDPPSNYEICPSCGTEFGYQDATRSHLELRQRWLDSGAYWHSRVVQKPLGWNASDQLKALERMAVRGDVKIERRASIRTHGHHESVAVLVVAEVLNCLLKCLGCVGHGSSMPQISRYVKYIIAQIR